MLEVLLLANQFLAALVEPEVKKRRCCALAWTRASLEYFYF